MNFYFVYASTNIIEELKDKVSGIYFNENNFNYKSWAKHYGSYILCHAEVSLDDTFGCYDFCCLRNLQ